MTPQPAPATDLGYGALRPSVAVAVRGGAGSCATGHAATGAICTSSRSSSLSTRGVNDRGSVFGGSPFLAGDGPSV